MTRRYRRGARGVQADADGADGYQRALDRAFGLLAVRGRTTAEIKDRLERAGCASDDVARVIARLGELDYLDDGAFARSWVAERSTGSRPTGRRRLAWDLAQKGVPKAAIEAALNSLSPETEQSAAALVAEQLAARRAGWPKDRLRQSIYATLMRRGFDRDVIEYALARVGHLFADGGPNE